MSQLMQNLNWPGVPCLPPRTLDWQDNNGLTRLVREVVQNTPPEHDSGVFHYGEGGCFRSEMLLSLLTYCYARDWFDSHEIESLVGREDSLRNICGSERPDAQTIARFRRVHREDILRSLSQVLARSWRLRAGGDWMPEEGSYFQNSVSRFRPPPAQPDFRLEACDRVGQAIFADFIARDF